MKKNKGCCLVWILLVLALIIGAFFLWKNKSSFLDDSPMILKTEDELIITDHNRPENMDDTDKEHMHEIERIVSVRVLDIDKRTPIENVCFYSSVVGDSLKLDEGCTNEYGVVSLKFFKHPYGEIWLDNLPFGVKSLRECEPVKEDNYQDEVESIREESGFANVSSRDRTCKANELHPLIDKKNRLVYTGEVIGKSKEITLYIVKNK